MNAVIKVQRDQELELTENEAATIEHLLVDDVVPDEGSVVLPGRKVQPRNWRRLKQLVLWLERLRLNITLL